ncbi:MAG: non-canonical purine NTP pyrophosphatase, partial [Spirochaetaceae bacterium]|nr:non-canonical purine NTP pyrophosphatase [Spirochaetaceae bacterium]
MKIYLATGNEHKKREMQRIFSDFEIVIPKDEGIDFDPEETGNSFFENSLIKAKSLFDVVKAPVIADDSGLCVDALGGEPGVYTSRYAGKDAMHGRSDGKKI